MPTPYEIGKGAILEVLGFEAGNAFLDVIDNTPDFRHVKGLLASSTLNIRSPLVAASVQAFVPGLLTQAQVDALLALGTTPAGEAAPAISVHLPAGTPCQHDSAYTVATGGTFGPNDLVEVQHNGAVIGSFSAIYIATGNHA